MVESRSTSRRICRTVATLAVVKLEVTKRAQRRMKLVGAWWREHRPAAQDAFADVAVRGYLGPVTVLQPGSLGVPRVLYGPVLLPVGQGARVFLPVVP